MNPVIKGKCWCGYDSMTVYEIIPEAHWTMDKMDLEEMSNWVLETVLPGALEHPGYFREQGYTVIVAGKDFGCGSKSVEHPMAALKGAGIQLVLAESVSRYSYRNAINLGLPVITCPGIMNKIQTGDMIEADMQKGYLFNHTTGEQIDIPPLSEFAEKILSAGGLLEYIAAQGENKS